MKKHQLNTPRQCNSHSSKTRRRFKNIHHVDVYLQIPANFLGIYRNNAEIRDVTSCLYVFNVGAVHFSFETLKERKDLKGEKAHEVFDKTTSGDG
tara:strand:+ start:640 stop:924 length:285 start_codon:yes stop_codon:yes gene_type:complete